MAAASKKLQTTASDIAHTNMDVTLHMAVATEEMNVYYEHLVETKSFFSDRLREKASRDRLDGWIVCGSGLASLPESEGIKVIERIPVKDIPHWFVPQAQGHGREVVIANIQGQFVGIQTGRAHIYDTDGSSRQLKMITAPLIVAKGLGIAWLITTNAAGVNDNGNIRKGDVVVDVDYVNQFGMNPLLGQNDWRLGMRFPGKGDVADPYIFSRLERFIPEDHLHLGIYTLSGNSPLYEGAGDIVKGTYTELKNHNPEFVEAFGMSFAMEAMIMQHYNKPPQDNNGFDRQVRWVGLTVATNIIPPLRTVTKKQLREIAAPNPNPTSHKEVLEGGTVAEKTLIPAIIGLCKSFSVDPLPEV